MNLERVANFLASGLRPTQVATIIGCSPSRISQLLAQDNFKEILTAKQAEASKSSDEQATLDNRYLAVEHTLLKNIEEQAPTADLRDNIQALKVITERQFRKASINNPTQSGNITNIQQTVVLQLPKHALPEIILNESAEVISIDNRTLAPLSSEGVTHLFKTMKGEKNEPARLSEASSSVAQETIHQEIAYDCATATN